MQIVNPKALGKAQGYSNGIILEAGRTLFVAGQIGWTSEQKLVGPDMASQFAQALRNVMTVVHDAGGSATHVGRLTIYVTDKQAYIAARKEIGNAYREIMEGHFPAMALLEIQDLLEEGALVEIEATAVLP